MKKVLHVGCGTSTIQAMGPGFKDGSWEEVRFDINEEIEPDILGTIVDMSAVPDNSMDALWSSHNLEHVFYHEVPSVLREFRRVLRPDGFCVIICPDVYEVCRRVAQGTLTDVLYHSPAGPITPLDVMYGHIASVASGNPFMAHRTGFSHELLRQRLIQAGFGTVMGGRRPLLFDLWFVAFKSPRSDDDAKQNFLRYTGIPFG